jgi:hypothetical protein
MKKRKINHNDLVPWFTEDHGTLPASYITSCREFFEWLDKSNQEGFRAPGHKPQANKRQGLSNKRKQKKKRVGPAHKHSPGSAALCHMDSLSKISWILGHDSAIGAHGSRFASARTMEPS